MSTLYWGYQDFRERITSLWDTVEDTIQLMGFPLKQISLSGPKVLKNKRRENKNILKT